MNELLLYHDVIFHFYQKNSAIRERLLYIPHVNIGTTNITTHMNWLQNSAFSPSPKNFSAKLLGDKITPHSNWFLQMLQPNQGRQLDTNPYLYCTKGTSPKWYHFRLQPHSLLTCFANASNVKTTSYVRKVMLWPLKSTSVTFHPRQERNRPIALWFPSTVQGNSNIAEHLLARGTVPVSNSKYF